jgi:ornithine carbamoyltransferase
MDLEGVRHLISLRDLDRSEIDWMIERALPYSEGKLVGQPLKGRAIGIYFALTSTRTRTAFTTGAMRLGAHVISYGPGDLQLNTGETLRDTGKVLAGMLDALVLRTPDDPSEMVALAAQKRMAIINAMSLHEHPTQALADMVTMHQQFGRIENVRVLYVGEGNSTACALSLALAQYPGAELHLRTPRGYGLPASVQAVVSGSAAKGTVEERHDLDRLPGAVDVVYTTRWQTTGTSKRDENWRDIFAPFRASAALLDRYPSAVFMHDLPAHRGDEVDAEVLDGPQSIVFQQSSNKLYSAMAALEWCLPSG